VKLGLRKGDGALLVGVLAGIALTRAAWEPAAWVGAALVVFCCATSGHVWRRLAALDGVTRVLPPVLVCLLVVWVMRDLVWGGVPLSRDHPVHFYKTWMLVHDLLPSGRLWGWTDRWYAGLPLNEVYPVLPYLWSAGAHILTFGLVDLETSYGLGQLALWMLLCLVSYAWGSRLGGPIAGIAAALFVLLDPGACRGGGREGGWVYLFQFGVWPQALAVTLALASGLAALRVVRGGSRRWVAAASVLGCGALLAHPMGLVPLVGIHLATWVGVRLEAGDGVDSPRIWRLVGSLVLAAALSACWTVVFLANQAYVRASASTWRDLDDLGRSLLRGELFLDGWAVPGVLGLVGAVVLARRRRAEDIAVLGLVLASVTLASPHIWATLLGDPLPGVLASVQYDRLVIHAKPLFFVMAGVGVSAIARQIWGPHPGPLPGGEGGSSWRRHVAVGLLCLFLGPLALWAGRGGLAVLPEVGQIPTVERMPEARDLDRLSSWLAARAADHRGTPLRVALRHGPGERRVLEELFLVAARAGVSIHHLSGTPADPFTYRSYDDSPSELRALGVRYLVSRGPFERSDLRRVETFGPWDVMEVAGPAEARVTLEGPGRIGIARFEDELVRVVLHGVSEESALVIHRSPHRRWRAAIDGEPAAIDALPRGSGATFMRVTGLHDGTLELRYTRLPADVLGLVVSLLAFLVVVALAPPVRLTPAPLERLFQRIAEVRPGRRAQLAVEVAAGVVAIAGIAAVLWGAPHERPGRSLIDELERARFTAEPAPPCRTEGICRVAEVPPVRVLRARVGRVAPCLRITAPTAGRFRLVFPAGPAGRSIRGSWYWTGGPRAELEVRPTPLHVAAPSVSVRVGSREDVLAPGRAGQWRDVSLAGPTASDEVELDLRSASPGRVDACFRLEVQ